MLMSHSSIAQHDRMDNIKLSVTVLNYGTVRLVIIKCHSVSWY